MGNAKTKDQDYLKAEKLLLNSYNNTGLEFSPNEILNYKLKIQDARNYFLDNFDYYIIFNSYIFQQRMNILYENFNSKVEQFVNNNKPFTILINFDEEETFEEEEIEIDLDPLFTIVLEKLEINTKIYVDMTNISAKYIKYFFKHIIESIDLYKHNRKFDCFYSLMPNTDYFIKNDFSIAYISNNKYDPRDISSEYFKAIFSNDDVKRILNCRYSRSEANDHLEGLIYELKPNFAKLFVLISFGNKPDSFIIENESQFVLIQTCIDNCQTVDITLDLLSNFSENVSNLNTFYQNLKKNLSVLIKKCIMIMNNKQGRDNTLILRFTSRKYFERFHFEEIFNITDMVCKNNNNLKFICEFLFLKNYDLHSARSSNKLINNTVLIENFDINYLLEIDYSFYLKYLHKRKHIQLPSIKILDELLTPATYVRTSSEVIMNSDDLKQFLL